METQCKARRGRRWTYTDGKVEGQSDGAKVGGGEGQAWRGEEVFGVGERAHEDGP
jgi:hypothetical protein